MHRVIEDVGEYFAPIEEALATVFIPALLGGKEGEQLRDLFTLPVRQAGLNIPNPAKKAGDGYQASLECTKALTASLLARSDLDAIGYAGSVKEARARTRKTKALRGLSDLKTLCKAEDRYPSRRMVRAKETGAWLNNLPNTFNGTVLSEEEFRDSLGCDSDSILSNSHRHATDVVRSLTSTMLSNARRETSSYTATMMSPRSGMRCVPVP